MDCRSQDVKKTFCGEAYDKVDEFTPTGKLQSGAYLIGRMLSLVSTDLSKKDASQIVAQELSSDWIEKNVYPIDTPAIAKKILDTYEQFRALRKFESRDVKKTDDWKKNSLDFHKKMTENAFDIRTQNKTYQGKLEALHKVKMTKEDEDYYVDNCKGSYKATCSNFVSSKWRKADKRATKTAESDNQKREEMRKSREEQLQSSKEQMSEYLAEMSNERESRDDEFQGVFKVPNLTERRKTRSSTEVKEDTNLDSTSFPKVPIRSGRKTLNEDIMRCAVECSSDYKVSWEDLVGIIVDTANIIFHQEWKKESNFDENSDNAEGVSEIKTEVESSDESDLDDDTKEDQSTGRKRRRSDLDKTYVFPSRRCLNNWLEDASYLNLRFAGDQLINKGDNTVTVGTDDTTKAAGHKMYDVKADHITLAGPDQTRKVFTTGYSENTSHSGVDSAKTYQHKLQCLAVLTDSSVEEILSSIDFWMADRAGDNSVMLQTLGIAEDKILKCCAHVILGIDHAIDKVFKDIEQRIGVHKLLDVSAGTKAFSASTSIHTLGQIAIAKLLSPSHAANSVSLYGEYVSWLQEKQRKLDTFGGFVANRFGRIAEIAQKFLAHRQSILEFFESVVDKNSNKLVLAVATYIQSDWFLCCSEVYSEIGDMIIFPLMDILGIDKAKQDKRDDRNWSGIHNFFKEKLPLLENQRETLSKSVDCKDKLISAVLDEVVVSVKRQLSEMSYFRDITGEKLDSPLPDPEKLKFAPMTNLGCEGEFAKLDNRVKISGGSTSVDTHSRKNIVSTNGLLVDTSFVELSSNEKKRQWKWARASPQVQEAKKLHKDFLETVKAAKILAVQKKEAMKKKKSIKVIKLLESCKSHGGPVTPSSLGLLDQLKSKDLLLEVGYLRATIAPDIKQKRRIRLDTGKFKMENFSDQELRTSIRNAVNPESNLAETVETLLRVVFEEKS